MRNLLKFIVVVFLTLFFCGCHHNRYDYYRDSGSHQVKENLAKLKQDLSRYEVVVLNDSNCSQLVLPSKKFFVNGSANFTPEAYAALDLILSFASYHKEASVAIAGYYQTRGLEEFSQALALKRVQKIADYLRHSKIYNNFIYAYGKNDVFKTETVISADCVVVQFNYDWLR